LKDFEILYGAFQFSLIDQDNVSLMLRNAICSECLHLSILNQYISKSKDIIQGNATQTFTILILKESKCVCEGRTEEK
jgi:hypothetical protein